MSTMKLTRPHPGLLTVKIVQESIRLQGRWGEPLDDRISWRGHERGLPSPTESSDH